MMPWSRKMRFLLTLGVILMACWSDCRPFTNIHAGRNVINDAIINGPLTFNDNDRTSVHNHEENNIHQTIGSVEEYSGGGNLNPGWGPRLKNQSGINPGFNPGGDLGGPRLNPDCQSGSWIDVNLGPGLSIWVLDCQSGSQIDVNLGPGLSIWVPD